jgi:isoquinoline 1-oxidoreductase beta subunit
LGFGSRAAKLQIAAVQTRGAETFKDSRYERGTTGGPVRLDAAGNPVAFEAIATGEGPNGRLYGQQAGQADRSAVEGLSGKVYAIPATRIAHSLVPGPTSIGYWRSVGHSVNDFIYEAFLHEIAEAGGKDPFDLRASLLADSPRHLALLQAVADLSGGWQRGPYAAPDGSNRARGGAMASPFGSEVATIAEVSLQGGSVVVHDIWVAMDPGSIVNPAIIEAQVTSAVALDLSQTLVEGQVYMDGQPVARNYDSYAILTPDLMPNVHVRIIESGAAMGGIGEPGLPGVAPAVVNVVAALTGQRIRSLPLSRAGTLEDRQG